MRTTISPQITFEAPATDNCAAVTSSYVNSTYTYTTSTAPQLALDSNNTNLEWNSGNTALLHVLELDNPIVISKAASLPQVQIDFSTAYSHYCLVSTTTSYPGPPFVSVQVLGN